MPIGDGHDLKAQRFAGDPVLEKCYDGEHRMLPPEQGEAVRKVQQALLDLDYSLPVFGADGWFGSETAEAVSRFKRAQGISPSDGVVGPKTIEALDRLFQGELNLSPTVVVVGGCPPLTTLPEQAVSYAEYIAVVQCVERAMRTLDARRTISLLRQIYYRGADWDHVIPCGTNFDNLEALMGHKLFAILKASQVVGDPLAQIQTDMGHVFTGLEAMCCPNSSVTLERFGLQFERSIPNEEWATWVGDLGSAVTAKLHAEGGVVGANPLPWSNYVGGPHGEANRADLEGDIDAYAIRAGLINRLCRDTSMSPIDDAHLQDLSLSVILEEYYGALATPIGNQRSQRFRCFAESIGCQLSGSRIINREELKPLIANRVLTFARLWAFNIGILAQISDPGLQVYSLQITDFFFQLVGTAYRLRCFNMGDWKGTDHRGACCPMFSRTRNSCP